MKVVINERLAFPFSEEGRIHQQEGWGDLIGLTSAEIGRLPKAQQRAIENLQATFAIRPLGAALMVDSGEVILNDGTPVAATISPKGKTTSFVSWLK